MGLWGLGALKLSSARIEPWCRKVSSSPPHFLRHQTCHPTHLPLLAPALPSVNMSPNLDPPSDWAERLMTHCPMQTASYCQGRERDEVGVRWGDTFSRTVSGPTNGVFINMVNDQ